MQIRGDDMYSDEMKEKIIKDYLSTPLGEEKKQDVSKTVPTNTSSKAFKPTTSK